MKEWLRADTPIGDYRVTMRIGISGLGEVYQVRDELRGINGALKMLSASLGWDKTSLERFVQIIKSAPPLDHPNICKILDAGVTENGRPFMVSQLVYGRTLDEIGIGLARPLADKIKIAIQIAEALDAAHKKGVLHLGLKPANVMLNHHGQVKVLDFVFTLATQIALTSRGLRAPQHKPALGSVRYFSPEQVRGERPIPQSDIFSLGTLVYELFASQLPFSGHGIEEMSHSILSSQPELLTEQLQEAPPSINDVVLKALAKDPAERYHTAGEFAEALKQLANEEEKLRLANAKPDSKPKKEFFKKLLQSRLAKVLFVVAVLAALLNSLYRRVGNKSVPLPEEPLPFTRLTNSGKVIEAALAPDGQAVVYLMEDVGRHTLLYQAKVDEETHDRLLSTTNEAELSGVTFSPANDFVYYLKTTPQMRELFRVSLNGANQRLLAQVDSPVAFTDNNKQFAFVRRNGPESQLIVSGVKEPAERVIATLRSPAQLATSAPAWSHDGKSIVCAVQRAGNDLTLNLVSFAVEGGTEKVLASGRWAEIGRLAWLAGDEAILVNGREINAQNWQIWRINPATGEQRALTVGINDYHGLSLSFDTKQLSTVYYQRDTGIWLGTDENARQLTSGADDGFSGLTWLSNDKLVYSSRARKRAELWRKQTDQSQAQPLEALRPGDSQASLLPTASGDGKALVFAAVVGEQTSLWHAAMDNLQMRQLTKGPLAWLPQLASDGQTLLYSALTDGKAALLKLNVASGEATVLLNGSVWGGVLAPNAEQVAANYFDAASGTWKIIVFPVAGGKATATFEVSGTAHRVLRWTPEGSGIAYIITKRGVANLWQQPLQGAAAAALTQFSKQRIYNFAWSPDGKQLAVARGKLTSDAVLITGWNDPKAKK
jgi:eukaryotic-like serine/threonine-protein kinase